MSNIDTLGVLHLGNEVLKFLDLFVLKLNFVVVYSFKLVAFSLAVNYGLFIVIFGCFEVLKKFKLNGF
jgi:hypothetical protein